MHSFRNSILAVAALGLVLLGIGIVAGPLAAAYTIGGLILLSMLVSVIGIFVLAVVEARRRSASPMDLCPRCGHDLRNVVGRCPGCGRSGADRVSPDEIARRLEKLKTGSGDVVYVSSERPQPVVQSVPQAHIQVQHRRIRPRHRPSWWSKSTRR